MHCAAAFLCADADRVRLVRWKFSDAGGDRLPSLCIQMGRRALFLRSPVPSFRPLDLDVPYIFYDLMSCRSIKVLSDHRACPLLPRV